MKDVVEGFGDGIKEERRRGERRKTEKDGGERGVRDVEGD